MATLLSNDDPSPSRPKTLEQKYQKLSPREHILRLPDTYVGSVDKTTEERFVLKENRSSFELRSIEYVPAFFKIFDEILVNARDARVRDDSVKKIQVTFDRERGSICVQNDGNGLEVAIHAEHNVYIPELIFGHLLTSSNYDTGERRLTGGKNGYGSKLAAIFSTRFEVETVDATRKKKYHQVFEGNLSKINPPKITTSSVKSYVKITIYPDFAKLGYENFTEDMLAVLEKRVYDLAAVTPPDVVVTLNGQTLKVKKFENYVDLYVGPKSETPRSCETVNDRWQIAVCLSPDGQHRAISFVNGISTSRGGSHVNYIVNQITKKLVDHIATKKKKTVRTSFIKENLWVFVNATIEDAAFDSQIKELLTTPVAKFGSRCDISEKFIEKLGKDGIVDRALDMLSAQDTKELKKTDGKKRSSIRGIPKLDDAIWAGGPKSSQCTLILCEGDSAKTFATSGLAVIGREAFGIFPLRGKLLNVREASPQQLAGNAEFAAIKAILGLSQGKVYNDTKDLRYGSILILTDADLDGSHIKGLIMNMIHFHWASLLTNVDGFVRSMLTPIIKVRKGNEVQAFYTLTEYNEWKSKGDRHNWVPKYFKVSFLFEKPLHSKQE